VRSASNKIWCSIQNVKSAQYLVFWRKTVTSFVNVWSRAFRTVSKQYTSVTVNSHRQNSFCLEFRFMIFFNLIVGNLLIKNNIHATKVVKWQITYIHKELVLVSNLGMSQNIAFQILPLLLLLISSVLCRVLHGESVSRPTGLNGLKTKLRGLSPRANYTDRAAAAGRRS
jgi:hypothetical protein